jgi:hypothetical protein
LLWIVSRAGNKTNGYLGRNTSIPFDHAGLHLGHTAQRIHDTAELNEQPVTYRLDRFVYISRGLSASGGISTKRKPR